MRVALDVSALPPQPAGAGVYVRELARALAASTDVDLVLVATSGDDRRWHDLATGAEVVAGVPRARPARLAWEQARAPRLARRLGVDVWHGPHYTMPVAPGVPTVVTVHDLTFFDHPEWHERSKVLFFRPMIRLAARRADLLVCVSGFTARRLDERLRPRASVSVIPHGVDHERFRPDGDAAADDRLLAEWGVRPPFVAFAGTMEPRKDVPALVSAFGRVASEHPDLRLVLAGQAGWGSRAVDAAVAASPVAERVVRTGYVPAEVVPALFRRATVVAYPSLEEGFGLPALEALACGTPLVTTTGSAMAEVVGSAAVLVEPGNVDGLADSLRRLLGDGAEQDRLRAAGPEVAAGYTWEACARQHVEAYGRARSGA